MVRNARTTRWWLALGPWNGLLAAAVLLAATALSGGAEPLTGRVGPTVASLREGAEALDAAGLPSYARKQRDLAETIQLWAVAHEALTGGHVDGLEGLGKSLNAGARLYERTDARKSELLKQQVVVVEQAVAALRPFVGAAPPAEAAAGLALLTVQVKAAPVRIVLVEPARTFTTPAEMTAYLKSAAEHWNEATVVFQFDDAVPFATVRQVVNAVADAALKGPTRIDGLKLRSAAPGARLGRTPPGPLPDDVRQVQAQ
ncbi:MAG: hypothetical protein GX591_18785 [Planctomycetes bacterium]|nr:hypothetical protein [Planctomycetota bacterium]